jgi:CRP-like cAMP-binding protein
MKKPVCNELVAGGCLANCLELCSGLKNGGASRLDLGETAPRFTEHKAAARRTIFQQGERVAGVPIVCSGWAAAATTLSNNRRQIVSLLLPGDMISGALVFGDKLNFSVEAITDVTYHSYDRAEFRAAMSANPNLFETILKAWAEENIQVVQLAVGLGQCTAEERIARLVLKLMERLALRGLVKDRTFHFPLRQRHIAEITGLTPVHVNRVVGELRQQGLMDIRNRALTIQNTAALRRICNM